MKKKNIIYTIAAVALVALVGIKLIDNKNTIDDKAAKAIADNIFDEIPVKVAEVKYQEISNSISESGTFSAVQDLKLSAQSQGQITQLLVKKSQFVTKGTLLAVVDNTSLSSQIETAQSALNKAIADEERTGNALKSGGVSQQQFENAQLQVKNSRSSLEQLKQQSKNFRIVAPISGTVNDIFIEQGSFVAPGTQLLEIVDITTLNLIVRIDPKVFPNIKTGQKVSVTAEPYPGVQLQGKVETINVKADMSQKIEVGVAIQNNPKYQVLHGMYGTATFDSDNATQQVKNSITIPREAVVGSVQNAEVFVLQPDSTVSLKTISVGKSIGNNVEVLNGLKEHEFVVTAGQVNLEEGSKVLVKK
jgi:membrane fusion protein (multidrug efflux system)